MKDKVFKDSDGDYQSLSVGVAERGCIAIWNTNKASDTVWLLPVEALRMARALTKAAEKALKT